MSDGPDTKGTGETDWAALSRRVSQVFTPAVPIDEDELFAGRAEQIDKAIAAINQRGQHAVVYGERGVGKTSLANVLSSRLVSDSGEKALAPRVNCDATDTFSSLWKKVLARVHLTDQTRAAGFREAPHQKTRPAAEKLPAKTPVTPDAVSALLGQLGRHRVLLVIFDEFDRLTHQPARRAMADTIKALSDYAVNATLVVVGVADTVGELIAEHESIDRCLTQIPMPRMEVGELYELLDKGTSKLGMELQPKARDKIAVLSQGLPPYTHRLALHATGAAIRSQRRVITQGDVSHAIRSVVEDAQQSLRENYRKAVSSPQAGNLFRTGTARMRARENRRLRLFRSSRRERADVAYHEETLRNPEFRQAPEQFLPRRARVRPPEGGPKAPVPLSVQRPSHAALRHHERYRRQRDRRVTERAVRGAAARGHRATGSSGSPSPRA